MITVGTPGHPLASIIILTVDNLEMLRGCLTSVASSIEPQTLHYEVLVVFQQTGRRSAEAYLAEIHGIRALYPQLNLGFAGGCNLAARYAKGRYLVFLNDDAQPHRNWLQWLVAAADADDTVGAVGSRILFPDGTLQEAGVVIWGDGSAHPLGRGEPPGSLSRSYVRTVDYASANGLLVRRSAFDRAGGFDERYFPGYYEDVDLCFSLRHELGLSILYEPRSVIAHREAATTKRDPAFREFLFHRHRTLFSQKWANVLTAYPTPAPQSPIAIEEAVLRARGNPKQVLVVDDRVPGIGMGSGAGRTADLLEDLAGAGYAVAMCPTDGIASTENPLAGLGIDLISEPLGVHIARPEKRYDAVIISRPHNYLAFATDVRRALPDAALIYDVEALYNRRLFIQAQMAEEVTRSERVWAEADHMESLEIEIARSADWLVSISESEVQWLQAIEGHAPIDFMRPLGSRIAMTSVALDSRHGAVFVAGWLAGDRSPNVDALRWYVREIVPRVRKAIPDFVTYVSGARPPVGVQALEGPGVVLLGLIQRLDEVYAMARVAVAPMLAGAGVKIKTVEALQFGVPVVATTVGAEGLGLTDGLEIDISDDPEEYANRVIALVSDDILWARRRETIAQKVRQWENERLRWPEVITKALRGVGALGQERQRSLTFAIAGAPKSNNG